MDYEIRSFSNSDLSSRGKLMSIEFNDLPFEPKRLYWIHSVPKGESRGNHAHKKLSQIFWLVSGSVKVEISNESYKELITLKKDNDFLLVNPGLWRSLFDFSNDAVLMVLADHPFDRGDYIHDWKEFINWRNNAR